MRGFLDPGLRRDDEEASTIRNETKIEKKINNTIDL
jgi:hypothetical protein